MMKIVCGMMFKQGDIVLVKFPFTNLEYFKRRPVLVISGDSFNSKTSDIIVCGITSNLSHKDFYVLINNDDLVDGSLIKESIVKTSHIATLSKSIVIKKIGTIRHDTMVHILEELNNVLRN
ncbi:MAG TPA: type II toxin-antitoxin system PemK/MazF family toxin [Anaerovoracaceae bacterium]|nr:type II toxin-antitoxin system PemK/MazF family toxin [Anaerovoracaceae bacterium]